MRKVNGVFSGLNIAEITPDSITLTLSSIQQTAGIGATLLSMAVSTVSVMALGQILGNLVYVPYLSSKRFKLYYAHSTFNRKNWTAAPPHVASTGLDEVLDSFESKEMFGNSSFFIPQGKETIIGIFNKESSSFDIFKFSNGKK